MEPGKVAPSPPRLASTGASNSWPPLRQATLEPKAYGVEAEQSRRMCAWEVGVGLAGAGQRGPSSSLELNEPARREVMQKIRRPPPLPPQQKNPRNRPAPAAPATQPVGVLEATRCPASGRVVLSHLKYLISLTLRFFASFSISSAHSLRGTARKS